MEDLFDVAKVVKIEKTAATAGVLEFFCSSVICRAIVVVVFRRRRCDLCVGGLFFFFGYVSLAGGGWCGAVHSFHFGRSEPGIVRIELYYN